MIQESLALGFPIGKYILAAALMVAFYWFLFREKATFNNCRVYLLSIALVAILISQFSIVVYTPPAEIVEIEEVQTMPIISNNQYSSNQSAISQVPVLAANPKSAEKVAEPNKYLALLTVKMVALAVYITVTSILFILLLIQLFSILALKRRGKLTVKDGFEIVESAEIPTPFSFYKTIFLSPNLTGSKLEMILKHEQWHIKHRHYLDVFIIEILVRLFWFNPVLWWVRRELRNVSEFHADRSVLDEGQDLYKYQTVILEEVMENNPYLANGFNNSFTKKRFIMMKNKCHIRFATLRRALILPFFIGVFSLLCFTTGKSEVKYKAKNIEKSDSSTINLSISDTIGVVTDSSTLATNGYIINNQQVTYNTREAQMKPITDFSKRLVLAINMLHELTYNSNAPVTSKDINHIITLLDIKFANINLDKTAYSPEFLSSITKTDVEKSFLYLLKIKKEVFMLRREPNMYRKTKLFQNILNKLIQDELISKIINESVKALPSNAGMQPTTTSIIMSTAQITSTSSQINNAGKERETLDAKIWKEAYRAKNNQIKVSDLPYDSDETKIARIEKNKNETRVTLAIPINYNEHWVYFDKAFAIVDNNSQDRYVIRRLENDLPLDKTIIISNNNQKMIEITMVFPPLQKSVEFVDIIEYHSDDAVKMSNGNGNWKFMNIPIAQYSGKIYK